LNKELETYYREPISIRLQLTFRPTSYKRLFQEKSGFIRKMLWQELYFNSMGIF